MNSTTDWEKTLLASLREIRRAPQKQWETKASRILRKALGIPAKTP